MRTLILSAAQVQLKSSSLYHSTMSSPVSIKNFRAAPSSFTAPSTGTPDSRAFQYTSTPPVANIPPRGTTGQNIAAADGTSQSQPTLDFIPSSMRPSVDGGISGFRKTNNTEIPLHLDPDELPDEEKAKVLARHLRSREEGAANTEPFRTALSASETASIHSRPSSRHSTVPRDTGKARENSDTFPILYDVPGADIT